MKTKILIAGLMMALVSGSLFAQKTKINLEATIVKWTGTKVVGSSHFGYIKLKEGNLNLKKGDIQNGTFVIDMASMTNTDIENQEYNKKLIGHLHSDDFFSVSKFPTAKLVISKATKFKDGKANVEGQLTIKGQTKPIEFVVEKKSDAYTASIVVDRTAYGIRYGSGSFFDNLGDKAIDNDFTMDVTLVL
ncbi:MAG: YceI family protein [Carboxylicivirga sp.]|jgi:polyisoprenoid-binding protein YceI|nr:YceI family protein [Carboxylicivirga sp.]MCT4646871.1 YceI family protein [Carboxylicivirga sp.]